MTSEIGFNDPGAVTLTIGGMPINQFGRGEFLVIKYNADRFDLMIGANGDATRSRKYDNSAKIHVKMLASAPQNAIFHAMMRVENTPINDRARATGLPVTVHDGVNRKSYIANVAWITKAADDPVGAVDGVERDWVLETHDLHDDYTPEIIPGISLAGGLELVTEIATIMAARFGPALPGR